MTRFTKAKRELFYLDLQLPSINWFRVTALLGAVYGSYANLFFISILNENIPHLQDMIPHYDLGVILGEEEPFTEMSEAAQELDRQYPKEGIQRRSQLN